MYTAVLVQRCSWSMDSMLGWVFFTLPVGLKSQWHSFDVTVPLGFDPMCLLVVERKFIVWGLEVCGPNCIVSDHYVSKNAQNSTVTDSVDLVQTV